MTNKDVESTGSESNGSNRQSSMKLCEVDQTFQRYRMDSEFNSPTGRKLFEREWGDRVSHQSLRTLSRRKFTKSQVLLLISDLKKVKDHLEEKMRKCSPDLLKKRTKEDWKLMAETTLNRVVLFNKRRSGEASRLLISDPSRRRKPMTKCWSLWILSKRIIGGHEFSMGEKIRILVFFLSAS